MVKIRQWFRVGYQYREFFMQGEHLDGFSLMRKIDLKEYWEKLVWHLYDINRSDMKDGREIDEI